MAKLLSSTGKTDVQITKDAKGWPVAIVFSPTSGDNPVYWPMKDWDELKVFVDRLAYPAAKNPDAEGASDE